MRRRPSGTAVSLLLACLLPPALAADPERGAQLYATPLRTGLLACIDCHGENPQAQNFGNIWSGRNAPALIERAIGLNTGGMGQYQGFYGAGEVADLAAYLGSLPRRLAFEDTTPGQRSATQRVTVSSSTKVGMGGLQLRTEGDYRIASTSCGDRLERFSSCVADVQFAPAQPGQRSGALLLVHDGSATPVRLPLTGRGLAPPPPRARLVPERVDFGAVPAQQDAALRLVHVHNDDTVPVRVLGWELPGEDFVHVGGSCLPQRLLPPGGRCSVALRFRPGGVGERQATLRVDLRGQPFAATLRGIGLASPATRLTAQPPVLDFGALPQPMTSAPLVVTLRNEGPVAAPLRPLRSTVPAFLIERDDCTAGRMLAPGQACTVQLALRADRETAYSGSLEFGLSGEPAQRLPLRGRVGAGPPPATSPALAATGPGALWTDASLLDFGETVPGHAAPVQTLTLRNRGTDTLAWDGIEAVGSAASAFTLRGSCSVAQPLPAGAACRLEIQPQLQRTGAHEASLVLWPVGAEAPAIVTLRARGVSAPAQPAPAVPTPPPGALHWTVVAAGDRVPEADVGDRVAAGGWQLHHRADVASGPLRWSIGGTQAADFEVDPASSCRAGQPLPARSSCTLMFRFQPSAAGLREARFGLVAGDERAAPLVLQGRGAAPAVAQVAWQAPDLVFAVPADGASPEPLPVWLHNAGAQMLSLSLPTAAPAGLTLAPASGPGACELPALALEPGGRCWLQLGWNRDPGLAAGAVVVVGGDAQALLAVAATEDPAGRSNLGQGGGAPALTGSSLAAWLGLALASLVLHRRERRARTMR